jgi:hypothetical protein
MRTFLRVAYQRLCTRPGLRFALGASAMFAAAAGTLAAQQDVVLAPATQSPARAPERFERVLWVGDVGAQASKAKQLGFTAVQVGRGVDPTPVREAGLGYYLDQPIGKGVLELRDEQWHPLAQKYEQTRDPAMLVRPGCYLGKGVLEQAARDAAAEAIRVTGAGLRFVALADEASATRHDAPLDTCACADCLAAFRKFAQRRYRTIAACNDALGTQWASFDDLVPMSTDQVRRRELGDTVLPRNLRPFALRQQFVDEQFAFAVQSIAGAVQRAVPGVPVGLTGLPAPGAFGGNDYSRLLAGLTLAEPYDFGGASELAISLLPAGGHRYSTLFAPEPDSAAAQVPLARYLRSRFAWMAAHGYAGVVVWNDASVMAADGTASPFGAAVREASTRLATELDACAGAAIEASQCWVLESQASVRAWWMLDSARDGMTWVRRLSSYEMTHSTSQASRRAWIQLLQDLGQQPRFVGEQGLAERLLQEKPRCLILPACIALEDRAAQAIQNYVKAGGTVLADHSTGLYDADLALRPAGALDALFGIEQRSLRWDDLLVREGRSVGNEVMPLAEQQLQGRLGERRRNGDAFLENHEGRGHAFYLNAPVCDYTRFRLEESAVERARDLRRRVRAVLQQAGIDPPCDVRGQGLPTCVERVALRLRDGRSVLVIRLNALEAPELMQRLGKDGALAITVELPRERHLRHLGGDDLGTAAKFELRLDPWGALFLEDVPR